MCKKFITVPVSILMFATMFVLVSGVSSFAQPAWSNKSAEEMPQAFMEAEDANGDGKVTMDELPADVIYERQIGPFLGGYQPEGSPEPAGG